MSSRRRRSKQPGFSFPPVYNYPPFWTIQTTKSTREKQLILWENLICAFMASINKTEMDLFTTLDTPLFKNSKIGRQLSKDQANQIIDFLVSRKRAVWLDDQKIRVRIIWRTPEEWGNLVRKWLDSIGSLNTVMTYEELINGEDTEGQPFHGLSAQLFHEAMQAMEAAGKAKLYPGKTILENGVKFFKS